MLHKKIEKFKINLRGIINSLLTFDNCQSCEHFIKHQINDREEKIVLIVSGQLGQEIIENIHQLKQIISIFVFCGNKQRNELWAKNYPKVDLLLYFFFFIFSI